jgi:cytochrome c peroxidase
MINARTPAANGPDTRRQSTPSVVGALALVLSLAGCGGGESGTGTSAQPAKLSAIALLGEKAFSDVSLSASGRMACSTCHNPGNAHAQTDGRAVPLGGPNLDQPGFRNAPSLRYLQSNPAFFFDKEDSPTGGFDRDGRAADLAQQARRPFLAAHEMANASISDLIDRLSHAGYAEDFKRVFGADIFNRTDDAFDRLTLSLAQYQKEDPDFRPFDSKYDAFLAGRAALSSQELRGLALFNASDKGNCAACHPSARGTDGSPPLFTDFTFDNLGVPRNYDIPAAADPDYYDLGLCGPDRLDLADHKDLCGAFKVPTLRNIEKTAPYFHNGRFQTLDDVVAFYVRRDTNPGEWYPVGAEGSIKKFDDLPVAYHANVNVTEVPYNRKPGMDPALSTAEIDDVVAFLKTLTDGYKAL